jgi:SAM-dependent methyltransferase
VATDSRFQPGCFSYPFGPERPHSLFGSGADVGNGMNWFHRQLCGSGRWRRRLENELLPWALQGAQLGDDVLEIGPGPGATTELLRGWTQRLTALEVEATAAAALQRRLEGSGVRIIHGDGTAMPFADCSFSGVVSLTMLHHVPSASLQDRLLAETRRVLRPGGVFAGFDGVGCFLFRLVHLGDTYTPVGPDTLGRRLEAAGFTEVAVERARTRFRFRASRGYPGAAGILSFDRKGQASDLLPIRESRRGRHR